MKAKKKPAATRGARKRVAGPASKIPAKTGALGPGKKSNFSKKISAIFNRANVEYALKIFKECGNGIEIWRTYHAFRIQKLRVPEEILKIIDGFVMKMILAESASQAARAIGLIKKSKAKQAVIMESVDSLMRANVERSSLTDEENKNFPKLTDDQIFERVAKAYGRQTGSVERVWYARQNRKKAASNAGESGKSVKLNILTHRIK